MDRPPLRDYQQEAVEWARLNRRGLLADEMGLGKSRVAIEAAEGPTLVVGPAMVMDGGNWDDELAKWADDPGRFTQTAYSRLSPIVPSGKGHAPSVKLAPEFDRQWGTVILDEAHYVKSRNATRSGLVDALSNRTDRLLMLTGTPIPNYAPELFHLAQLLRPADAKRGEDLGSYWRWVGRWFRVYSTEYAKYNVGDLLACGPRCFDRSAWDPCVHYTEFAQETLGGQFLRRRGADVLPELPILTEVTLDTPMGPKQGREYRRMKRDYVAMVEDDQVVAWSSAARHVKLDLLTTGLDLVTDAGVPAKATAAQIAKADNGKLAVLGSLLESRSTPVVVMAHYQRTVEAAYRLARSLGLRAAYVHGGVADRAKPIRDFKGGSIDVLIGSLDTLAEGLTLTRADLLVMVERSYKPSRNQQAIRRIHRLGQDRPCTVVTLITPDSVDHNKTAMLETKTDRQIRVMSAAAVKRIL